MYDVSLATEWATGVDGFTFPLRNKTAFKLSFDSLMKSLHSSASNGIAVLPSGHLHRCRRTRNAVLYYVEKFSYLFANRDVLVLESSTAVVLIIISACCFGTSKSRTRSYYSLC